MDLINLVAGVLLVLFGLRFLRKGFARVMGGDMIDWLQGFTRTRARSFLGGVAGGIVMPSSTATAMLSVQMTRRGKVSWRNVLAVLLGAQLGTTALIQVLSFDLRDFAGGFLAIGAALFLFMASPRPRGIGQALLAFGFMLLGMGFLNESATALGNDPAVENLFVALGQLPWLLLFAAVLLTLLVQSATASIALALALVASGQISLTMLMLWVLGANIGLSLTVLTAGWSETQGKRLGLAILLIKLPLALLCATLALMSADAVLADLPGSLSQQAAWTHTLFNLLAAGAIFFAAPLERWVSILVPMPKTPSATNVTRLDPLLLLNPALAVNAALRETLRMFDSLHLMRESVMQALAEGVLPDTLKPDIAQRSRDIRSSAEEIVEFLDGIPDDALDEKDQALKETMDDFMRELPIIARTLGADLRDELERLLKQHPKAVEAARPLLVEAAGRLTQQMNTVARMLMRERPELGRKILERKRDNSRWMIQAKRSHADLPYPAWRILDGFQQLNRRLSGVAYVYCRNDPEVEELPA
ncbi:MAG: Na/Pi cotransporter family protein [Gammaproteobacteria bacterium]|nr:Na/Pi cotransporter family protein [Gammaproteobacteria bacterium]